MTYLQPRQLYPKPHEIFGKEYMLGDSPGDESSKRVQWDNDKTRTLLEIIKSVNNGEFLKLLKQPLEEKKRQMQTLKAGWDMVRRIMLRKYPDFALSRVQLSDKWRKLHCNKTADPSQEYPKKTTDELMREFGVYDDNDGEDMHHVGLSGNPITEPVITVNMEYPHHDDGGDPGQSSPPMGKRQKTTEDLIAEIESEEYVPPPPSSKGKKKYVKLSEVEGRTPVECKRIELMVREHKARMVREGEIFHYERRIKQKKLEILEILKSKLENQQSVNLDVLTL